VDTHPSKETIMNGGSAGGNRQTAQTEQLAPVDDTGAALYRAAVAYLRGVLQTIAEGHPSPRALAAEGVRVAEVALAGRQRRAA
jgi:hypothetical protein